MRYLIIMALAFCAGYATHLEQSTDTALPPVTVTVVEGDTMQDIILDLKKKYNDGRDWREIAYYAEKDNKIGRHIYPGQQLVFKMEDHDKKWTVQLAKAALTAAGCTIGK